MHPGDSSSLYSILSPKIPHESQVPYDYHLSCLFDSSFVASSSGFFAELTPP